MLTYLGTFGLLVVGLTSNFQHCMDGGQDNLQYKTPRQDNLQYKTTRQQDNLQHGTRDTEQYGAQQYGARDTEQYGARDTEQYGARDTEQYGARDMKQYRARDTDQYGDRDTDQYGDRDTEQYGDRDTEQYGARDTEQYGARDTEQYGARGAHDRLRQAETFKDEDYFISTNSAGWQKANADCVNHLGKGASLLTIETQEELKYVNKMLGRLVESASKFWIGAENAGGKFIWSLKKKPLEDWAPWDTENGYPKSIGGGSNRVAINFKNRSEAYWRNFQDSTQERYICEIARSKTT